MKNLTIRNLPPAVADALEREKGRRGASLNQTVVDLLAQGLGVGALRSNGLASLAGGWSEAQFLAFESAMRPFADVDDELWRE
jgi:hypothetical protein